jgi:multisubunit Na+/H+ antiporter MnhB subunit
LKRIEPNLLLALSCLLTLSLVMLTGAMFGEPGGALKYPLMGAIVIVAFIIGNGLMQRRTGRVTPPLISLDTPQTAVWGGILPLLLMAFAAIPVFWPGHDYGLLIIIGSVLTGVAVESAMKARPPKA